MINQRTNTKFNYLPKLVFLTITALFFIHSPSLSWQTKSIPVLNRKFPDLALRTLTDEEISLSDYTGKKNVVLVTVRGWVGYW